MAGWIPAAASRPLRWGRRPLRRHSLLPRLPLLLCILLARGTSSSSHGGGGEGGWRPRAGRAPPPPRRQQPQPQRRRGGADDGPYGGDRDWRYAADERFPPGAQASGRGYDRGYDLGDDGGYGGTYGGDRDGMRDRHPPSPRDPPPPPPMGGRGPAPTLQQQQQQPMAGIHYNFPAAEDVDRQAEKARQRRAFGWRGERGEKKEGGGGGAADDDEEYGSLPLTDLPPARPHAGPEGAHAAAGGEGAGYATARQDAVQTYLSSRRLGRPRIMASSALVGYGAGAFLGRSVIGSANPAASLLAAIMALLTLLRNHYGELSKALGLGLISTVGRVGRVRRRYPTGPHLRAILRGRGRRPFPPVFEGGRDNPWRYAPREGYEDSDPDFSMAWTVAAMALMGGFCGGNLPLIPAWMGGTAGAAVLAFGTTLRGAKGDLYRTMGMRVVALLGEMRDVNAELGLAGKAGYTSGRILDRILILDRKHSIRQKIGAGVGWVAEKVSKKAQEVQSDMKED